MHDHGKIAVFCSASNNIDPQYNKVARDFVRAASLRGYAIVSGGTVKGTMGEIDREISDCGGYHIGIVPGFMKDIAAPGLSEIHWTETMSERQAMMRKGAVAAVALPGGIGTLDELIETLTQKKLGFYGGLVFALDLKGFYKPLEKLLDHYVDTGMLEQRHRDMIVFCTTPEEIIEKIDE